MIPHCPSPLRLHQVCLVFLAVVTGFMIAMPAIAAKPTVSATVEPAEIQPGGFALFVITIEEGYADEASALSLPPEVELAHPLPSTGRPQNGGRFRYASTITWQLTSDTPGEHEIPAQEIHINGIPYRTNATKLLVREDPDNPGAQLEPLMTLESAKRQIFVGEVIPITVNLYAHRQTFVRRIGLIELPKDNFAIQRFPTQPNESVITIGNMPYRAYAFQSTLSALKPGKFKLGPASAEVILDIPSGTREPFLHPLLNQMEARKVRPTCNEIEIEVLPLPTAGRPKDFKGVVGDFEITMAAEPKSLAIGDPISVDITITGTGNFDALMMPAMVESAGWKLYPPKRYNMESPNDAALGGTQHIGFSQVIVPQREQKDIPSFEFSYFSPAKKQYFTLRTKPVAIQVRGAPPSAGAPKPPSGTTSGPVPGIEALEKVPTVKPMVTDILTVPPARLHLLASAPPLWRNQRFLIANGIGMGVLALLIMSKLLAGILKERRQAPNVALRALWKNLHQRKLSKERFYALALQYAEARQLSGEALLDLQKRHDEYAYSPGHADVGSEPASPEERAAVFAVLKSAAS